MADDCGRVNPVSPHFLNRDVHEELFHGRPAKKHPEADPGRSASETVEGTEEESGNPTHGFHIDLRI